METKKYLKLVLTFLFVLIFRMTSEAQDIPALRDISDPGERARIQALVDGARGEGKLEWLGVMVEPGHAKYILDKFKAYYGLSNLITQYTYTNTAQLITNVEQLLKARRNNFDVVWNQSWEWFKSLIARGKVMRYDSPKYKEYTLSNQAGLSVPGYWVSDAVSFGPMYNPKALAKAGIKNFSPTSWWDFVDRKLAKLVSMVDVCGSISTSQAAIGWRKVLGAEWFKKLGKDVKPLLYSKTAQGRDWVASGECPIMLTSHGKNAEIALKSGASIQLLYPKEGVVFNPFSLIIMADAPHPNVAKLFIDYMRSAVGTNTIADSGAFFFFGRPGVKSVAPDLQPPWEKVNQIPMNWDVDGTEDSVRDIQKLCTEAGLCR